MRWLPDTCPRCGRCGYRGKRCPRCGFDFRAAEQRPRDERIIRAAVIHDRTGGGGALFDPEDYTSDDFDVIIAAAERTA